ncbi:FAD-dependent oxidoreductase [Aeromicrobium sp. UC242_57]|uniref:FAD-dependent oxidoreductase n=1 Tax=Aeromicrobium sp. UC242_57 TaxID=3374624 RepID=UPI0037A5AFE6
MHEAYDNTNHGDDRGTLVAFVSDVQADEVLRLDADERQATILASLARYFGPEAEQPLTYFESDWTSEELGSGAYGAASTSVVSPGSGPACANRPARSRSAAPTSPDSASSTSTARCASVPSSADHILTSS